MPKVRTVLRPDEEIEVSDAEVATLRAQGLLHEAEAKPAPAPKKKED